MLPEYEQRLSEIVSSYSSVSSFEEEGYIDYVQAVNVAISQVQMEAK